MTAPNAEQFDNLVQADGAPADDSSLTPQRRRARWLLPTATLSLGLVGVGLVVTAVLLPLNGADVHAAPAQDRSSTPTATATATPRAGVSGSPTPKATASGVASQVDVDWVDRVSEDAGIPASALAAYAGAALAVAQTHPGCGLGWNTLAGIGLVESEHGTISGGAIGDDGIAVPAIIGIPLDGNGVEAIRDTDGGTMDGDKTWDRAVGPMQFIPTTWTAFGRDGDGDGTIEVHDIEDAALSAAEYLCASGGDLATSAEWIAAIHAYNPSVEYNNRVAAAAEQYAAIG